MALLLAILLVASLAQAQTLSVRLNGSTGGISIEGPVAAELGAGARFVDAPFGRGVEAASGPAVVIAAQQRLWGPRGSIFFLFSASRTLAPARERNRDPLRIPLTESPALSLVVVETSRSVDLEWRLAALAESNRQGKISLSRLTGGRWYSLAVAWDAAEGALAFYLNGVRQAEPRPANSGEPWRMSLGSAQLWRLGGGAGEGDRAVRFAVSRVELYADFLDDEAAAEAAQRFKPARPAGEGRTIYTDGLDLSPYRRTLVWEADLSAEPVAVKEMDLISGARRVPPPEGTEWLLEGVGEARATEGEWVVEADPDRSGGYVVLWSLREQPADLLLEFDVCLEETGRGENIVFLAARGLRGENVAVAGGYPRGGILLNYVEGALESYSISYRAARRRTSEIRKNRGFRLVGVGDDRLSFVEAGCRRVRVLKFGGTLRLETDGVLAAAYDDDLSYGPLRGAGAIGLAQSSDAGRVRYRSIKVWKVGKAGRKTGE